MPEHLGAFDAFVELFDADFGHARADGPATFSIFGVVHVLGVALEVAEVLVQTLFIEPGSPWENAYIESFNSRLGDEVLKRELFTSLSEASVILEDHRLHYITNDHTHRWAT